MCEQAGCKASPLCDDLIVLEKYFDLYYLVFSLPSSEVCSGKLFDISRFKCCILSALAVQLKMQLGCVKNISSRLLINFNTGLMPNETSF